MWSVDMMELTEYLFHHSLSIVSSLQFYCNDDTSWPTWNDLRWTWCNLEILGPNEDTVLLLICMGSGFFNCLESRWFYLSELQQRNKIMTIMIVCSCVFWCLYSPSFWMLMMVLPSLRALQCWSISGIIVSWTDCTWNNLTESIPSDVGRDWIELDREATQQST